MKFDQHFLKNEKIAKQIVSYLKIKKDSILEIGPGKGILSKYLPKATLIEIDKNLFKKLKDKFPNHKIINDNVLNRNLNYDKIIGNIPYSICEPLINKLLKSKFKLTILMVPKKFLDRGLLKLIIPKLLEVNTLKTIDKKEFSPQPKVDSKIISIKKKKLNSEEQTLKELYQSSNKKLKNITKEDFKFKEKKIRELNLKEWQEIINSIF